MLHRTQYREDRRFRPQNFLLERGTNLLIPLAQLRASTDPQSSLAPAIVSFDTPKTKVGRKRGYTGDQEKKELNFEYGQDRR
jgi:hypothetical protein